jgi:hypothetical protein
MIEKHVVGAFPHRITAAFTKAYLEVYGIQTLKPTYQVMIFFNDPDVTDRTARMDRPSYAGRFGVFGHIKCGGSPGHCKVPEKIRRFDDRRSHPLTPSFRRVLVTEALRKAVSQGKKLTVTLIASCAESKSVVPGRKLLECSGVQLVTKD